jgi:hypothetical protein
MFANVTVRTKILTLLGVAVLALLVVVLIAFMGLKRKGEMLAEIGKNRMPSVQALMSINEAKTGIRSANRAADATAMYPENVAEITQQIKRRAESSRRPTRRGKSTKRCRKRPRKRRCGRPSSRPGMRGATRMWNSATC